MDDNNSTTMADVSTDLGSWPLRPVCLRKRSFDSFDSFGFHNKCNRITVSYIVTVITVSTGTYWYRTSPTLGWTLITKQTIKDRFQV